jgi:hypothetical protein
LIFGPLGEKLFPQPDKLIEIMATINIGKNFFIRNLLDIVFMILGLDLLKIFFNNNISFFFLAWRRCSD